MYQVPHILASARPQPIVTYDSIVYPFDIQVWGFTFACIIAQFILLLIMQYVWSKVSGRPNNIEYVYEGAYYGQTCNKHNKYLAMLQIFSSPLN